MDSAYLEDRLRWGLNVAARTLGVPTYAYRPSGTQRPLAAHNRFIRLHAVFTGINGSFTRPNGYGDALCHGMFDAAYTRPGDYLVQDDKVWFIAAQDKLQPVLCVRTNRLVSFTRPSAQAATGVNAYGGITADNLTSLMQEWPASVLIASREARSLAGLPGDTMTSCWTVLLPDCPGTILRTGDLMSDDLGRNGTVATTELSGLGWRLTVKQPTT